MWKMNVCIALEIDSRRFRVSLSFFMLYPVGHNLFSGHQIRIWFNEALLPSVELRDDVLSLFYSLCLWSFLLFERTTGEEEREWMWIERKVMWRKCESQRGRERVRDDRNDRILLRRALAIQVRLPFRSSNLHYALFWAFWNICRREKFAKSIFEMHWPPYNFSPSVVWLVRPSATDLIFR